jgi:hypothetical protein
MKIVDIKLSRRDDRDGDHTAEVHLLDEGVRFKSVFTSSDPEEAIRLAVKEACRDLQERLLKAVTVQHTVTF